MTPVQRYREKHLLLGLCRECSLPVLEDHTKCSKHCSLDSQRHRMTYPIRSKKIQAKNSQYRQDHRQRGLCRACPNPVEPGHVYCIICLQKLIFRSIKQREKYCSEGKCIGCGTKLHPEMDADHVKCLFCREQIPRGESWKYCPESYHQITI